MEAAEIPDPVQRSHGGVNEGARESQVTRIACGRPRSPRSEFLFNQSATLKIEKHSNGATAMIRLIGRLRMQHIEELTRLVQGAAQQTVIDLREVTLVDLEVVRFFVACETRGVQIKNCSAYIHQWMTQERLCGPSS